MKSVRITFATAVISAAIAAGCGDNAQPAATSDTVHQDTTVADTVDTAATTVDAVETTVPETTSATTVPDTAATLTVAGGDLPHAYTTNTLTFDDFITIYNPPPNLPTITGPGAVIIDHQQNVQNVRADGAYRFDTITWAFLDPRTDTELISAWADATDQTITISAGRTVGDGSTCTEGTTTDDLLPAIIACTRDNDVHTIQTVHDGWNHTPPIPPAAITAPITAAIPLTELGAHLTGWNIIHTTNETLINLTYNADTPFRRSDERRPPRMEPNERRRLRTVMD